MKKSYLLITILLAATALVGFKSFSTVKGDTPGSEKVVIINQDNFDKTIKKGIVVVDFWATWCHPCLKQAPIVGELSNEMKKVTFGKINVDKNRAISGKFGIRSIPTLIIFKNGVEQERVIGLHDKATLKQIISKYTK
ncbi:MAG: thioredoxin [Bacteroidales bacterium]|nr:thioredoxin [Bacteroidales bacterium]